MKAKKYWILTVGLAICMALIVGVRLRAGYILSGNKEVLSGIKNFEIKLVMPLTEKAAHGLKRKEVYKNIKSACRPYGIKVFSDLDIDYDQPDEIVERQEKEYLDLACSSHATLHVRIGEFVGPLVGGISKWYYYSVRIYILQYARLSRDPKIHFRAITWEDSFTNLCPEGEIAVDVQNTLWMILDDLIKDYLAANLAKAKSDRPIPKNEGGHATENRKPNRARSLAAGLACTLLLLGLGVVVVRRKLKL